MLVVDIVLMLFTQGRMGSITCSMLWYLYFGEGGRMSVGRVEGLELSGRVKIDFGGGNNVNG